MAPFPPDAAVLLQLPASELLRLQESTAFRTLLAQVHLLILWPPALASCQCVRKLFACLCTKRLLRDIAIRAVYAVSADAQPIQLEGKEVCPPFFGQCCIRT
jgi:hypothetical protein